MRRVEAALGSGIFLFAAPGVVAGLVPWLLTGWHSTGPATVVAAMGAVLIGYRHAVRAWWPRLRPWHGGS